MRGSVAQGASEAFCHKPVMLCQQCHIVVAAIATALGMRGMRAQRYGRHETSAREAQSHVGCICRMRGFVAGACHSFVRHARKIHGTPHK